MAGNTHLTRLLFGAAAVTGAAAWALAPRSFNDKRNNFVPVVPHVWYAHRGLHDAGSGLTARYAAESGEYVALARRMAM
ncbi:MAG: glycerophosphodiester phosphodiesterase, partial [Bifidobacterium boum]|nr:glycerophosphodiester phosphodiesterase [Bifidobacterium boum]